jgi:hypothetical protein
MTWHFVVKNWICNWPSIDDRVLCAYWFVKGKHICYWHTRNEMWLQQCNYDGFAGKVVGVVRVRGNYEKTTMSRILWQTESKTNPVVSITVISTAFWTSGCGIVATTLLPAHNIPHVTLHACAHARLLLIPTQFVSIRVRSEDHDIQFHRVAGWGQV